jgi:hypothetical protein
MDLTGKKYNRLLVLKPIWGISKSGRKEKKWECICDCGTIKSYFTYQLTHNIVKSCGCYNKEVLSKRKGENNPSWKGGNGTVNGRGYRYIRHGKDRGMLEHRIIFENYHNIKLLPHQSIHHINGIKTDNRIDNLELWDSSQPFGQRVEDKLDYYFSIITTYKDNPLYKDIISLHIKNFIKK